MEYVYSTKRRPLFVVPVPDGHAGMQRIGDSSRAV